MSSWGEALNNYVVEKCHTAPALPSIERYTRHTKASRNDANARDFDIVSNTIPNEQKRIEFEATTSRLAETHVKRGIAKEMTASNRGYNVITMQPRFGMSEDVVAQLGGDKPPLRGKRVFTRVDEYNVVTMQPNFEHVLEREAAFKKPQRPERNPRQTNILSGRYLANHEERAAREEEERRRKLDIIADHTSKYNPITTKYRRTDIEAKAVTDKQAKEEAQRTVVADHTYRVSTLVARSEGHAYDIVTNYVYNPEYVLKLQQHESKGIPQRAELRQAWEHQRDVDEALREHASTKAVNRISEERVREELRRGHHVLSNKPFGLSRDEECAIGFASDAVKEATAAPIRSLSILDEKTVLQRLDETTQPRPWVASQVLRESGPRTTHERTLNAVPSVATVDAATTSGRSRLLLPTLEKTLLEKSSMRHFS